MITTPVAFIIFNRPDTTEKVFQAIRQAQPRKLLVIADGPRADLPGEAEKCAAARAVIDQVDWECEVLTNYSDTNLGCRKRVSSGLDWVFSKVEEAIILEDDTLPHETFFNFCSTLLEHYRKNEEIMAIGGTNTLIDWKSESQDYHFSYQGSIWGWATWRRAWKLYDVHMRAWSENESKEAIKKLSFDNAVFQIRSELFDRCQKDLMDTWDYQWLFTRLLYQGLTIMPSVNLVSNIGFGEGATHTLDTNSKLSKLPTRSVGSVLRHPSTVKADLEYEMKALDFILNNQSSERKETLIGYSKRIAKKIMNI